MFFDAVLKESGRLLGEMPDPREEVIEPVKMEKNRQYYIRNKYHDMYVLDNNTLSSGKGVDLTKEEDVKKAILELKEEKPEQFVVTVNSGSGAGGEPNNQGSGEKPTFKNQEERVDYISKHGFEEYQKLTGE